MDVFYVAFSGGKDSIVALDLVQRALPHNRFKVLFGDTGMEFPDTYETVKEIKEWCSDKGIDFYEQNRIYQLKKRGGRLAHLQLLLGGAVAYIRHRLR